MSALRLAGVVMIGSLLLAGCQNKKPAAPSPQPTLESAQATARELQASYREVDPQARVGVVVEARPEQDLAAVGEVQLQDFHVGEAVSFIDSQQKPIANGSVLSLDQEANVLVVKYSLPSSGGRAPQPGDLLVRLK